MTRCEIYFLIKLMVEYLWVVLYNTAGAMAMN